MTEPTKSVEVALLPCPFCGAVPTQKAVVGQFENG